MLDYLTRLDPKVAKAIAAQPPSSGLDLRNVGTARARMGMIMKMVASQRGTVQAAPARLQSFHGLPPACVLVGSADLVVDENIARAQALNRAGVTTELVVLPGGFHGCDLMLPGAALSQRFHALRVAALRRGLGMTLSADVI